MNVHNPEWLHALADGELTGLRRWWVRRHVGRCPLCAAEYRHIQHVRQLLAANPVVPVMSDSPEFFWSKVNRDIQAQAGQTAAIPMPRLSLTDWLAQHRYAFASVTATIVLALALLFALPARRDRAVPLATVGHVATVLPDTAATAFESPEAEATVIWVSGLPWTETMTEMKTLFATLDS
jgi:anti-sigma factor RsiW